MTKDQLQQELKEKVKPGVKPSQIKEKKNSQNQNNYSDYSNQGILTPPDSPVLKPAKEGNLPPSIAENKQLKELQQQVKFHANQAQNYLTSLQKAQALIINLEEENKEFKKIKPTKTQSELEKALQEANEKIRKLEQQNDSEHILEKHSPYKEKVKELEAKIQNQYKTIEDLQNQVKNKDNNQGEQKLFTCYNCQKEQAIFLLVLELPEGKLCQPCWQSFRKKTKESLKEISPTKSFTCHNCQETKTEKEYRVKLDASSKLYSICPPCLPKVKEYNEKEADSQRELDIWE